jgi:NADH dehydrogenase
VAGGGLAGVELAAAVACRGAGHLRVVLVQGGERLVPQLADGFTTLARRVRAGLQDAGVELVLGDRVVRCGPEGVALASGRWIPSRTVLATVGTAPVRLPGLEGLPVDTRGRLLTRADLSVADGIWAAGDVARVEHPETGEPVPATALWAIKGGARIGANVARSLRGRPTRAFRYRGLGQAAVLGRRTAVAELYGIPLTGALAWWLRLAFFLRFVPLRSNALLVVRHTLRPRPLPPAARAVGADLPRAA